MIRIIKDRLYNSDEKSRTLYKNVALSLGVKGCAILISLVNMPVFMDYFHDNTVLGLWFTLLSMLNWILTFDLGIGNGLRNYFVQSYEKKDTEECRRLISSAYCSVAVIALVLSAVTMIAVPYVDWNSVCNVSAQLVAPRTLQQTLQILLIGIWIQFLLKLINSILYALQRSAIPNLLLLLSNTLLLLSTFLLKTDDVQRNLTRLAMAYILTANLPMLAATVLVFSKELKGLGLRLSAWKMAHTKRIIRLGCSFLLLQLLSMASFNTREFYIMRFVGPDSVVPYQIYHKLFSLVSTFFILATTPLWSAITQAAVQQDKQWIRNVYRKGTLLLLLFAGGSLIVIPMAQFLADIWLGSQTIPLKIAYCALFAIYNIEYMWISLHSHFENGLGQLRIQRLGYILSTVSLPVLAFFFVSMGLAWIGVVIAGIIALLPLCVMQYLHLRKLLM